MTVGIVIVSHSEKIALGVVELAEQMAGSVRLIAAGGTEDGRIGTSFDRVSTAIAEADDGDGVVILTDLGSAVMTAETALDFLEDDVRERVRLADAPLVEGAIEAAVSAEGGAAVEQVWAAAQSASGSFSTPASGSAPESETRAAGDAPTATADDSASADDSAPSGGGTAGEGDASPGRVSTNAVLINKDGLHARPAAELVRLATRFDVQLTINGVDAKSLLGVMALGLRAGNRVEIEADGPEAREAADALVELIESGFGE